MTKAMRKEKKNFARMHNTEKTNRGFNMILYKHPMFPGYNPWKHMHHNDRHRAVEKARRQKKVCIY